MAEINVPWLQIIQYITMVLMKALHVFVKDAIVYLLSSIYVYRFDVIYINGLWWCYIVETRFNYYVITVVIIVPLFIIYIYIGCTQLLISLHIYILVKPFDPFISIVNKAMFKQEFVPFKRVHINALSVVRSNLFWILYKYIAVYANVGT